MNPVPASVVLAAILAAVLALATPSHALEIVALPPESTSATPALAIVGDTGQRSPANLGNNATFGAVVTGAGVVLVDSGGSAKGAEAIERALRTVTDQPVVVVVNTGGQDHRWLGNGWFKARGARTLACADAVADQRARAGMQLTALDELVGADGMAGTEPVHAAEEITGRTWLTVGEVTLELICAGTAHTPGSMIVWHPDSRTAFAGDIVYRDRLPGVLAVSASAGWLRAFDTLEALAPNTVVPGHGPPGGLDRAKTDTRAYLERLRAEVGAVIAAGGTIAEATRIDQSRFARLSHFDELAGRNAQQVFMEMEWE